MFNQQCSKREKTAQLEIWDRNLGEINTERYVQKRNFIFGLCEESRGSTAEVNGLVLGFPYNSIQ